MISTVRETHRGVRICLVNTSLPENDTKPKLDLIAVHGLDTKSPDTWTWRSKESEEVNWLSHPDMLPSLVGTARIFTCDWPADLFQPSNLVQNKIDELARLLLTAIHDVRAEDPDRPLILIASCLGGIVLMKTLVMATSEYVHIQRAIRGILFFATPFRGTAFHDVATWAELVLKTQASIQGQQVSSLLEYLKVSNFNLGELVHDFTRLYKDSELCQVATFYEKRPSNRCWIRQGRPLVDKDSATLDIVPNPLPLDRHHRTMNKFFGPDDTQYILVASKIKEILHRIQEHKPLEKADAWIKKEHYTVERLKIERLSGDLLPMDQCYINLTIAKHSSYHSHRRILKSESSPFSLLARLKVEVPDKTMLVKLAKIFKPRRGKGGYRARARRILIRGQAGIGKTTLCKKIVHEFSHGMWNNIFDRVLWIPLRRLKCREPSSCDFEELFYREYFSGSPDGRFYARTLWHALRPSPGKTLFILDGFDEVSREWNRDESKYELLQALLDQPDIIITSRPHDTSINQLRDIDIELEAIGFHPDQVREYIRSSFVDPVGQESIAVESFLQRHRLIQDLVRIPIQLDALCYTWGTSGSSAPQTMTHVYKAIELGLWRKDISKLEKKYEGKPVTQAQMQHALESDVEELAHEEICFLEKLAFNAMLGDKVEFDAKYLDSIRKTTQKNRIFLSDNLRHLSFLRTSDTSLNPRDRNYHFIHLTYQEYFAARYFVRQWKSRGSLVDATTSQNVNPVDFLRRHKYAYYYDIVWRFVAGLFDSEGGEEAVRFLQVIEEEPRDLFGPSHQRLVMRCLSETMTKSPFRVNLDHTLSEWLLFETHYAVFPKLVCQIDFPDSALVIALQHSCACQSKSILTTLASRPYVSCSTIEAVLPVLEMIPHKSWKCAVCTVITKHRISLPSHLVRSIIGWLGDSNVRVRKLIEKALKVQTDLSDEVRNYIAEKLEKKSFQDGKSSKDLLMSSLKLAAKVLDKRSKMSVKATVETLRGSDEFVRFIFNNEPIQASSVGEIVWDEFGRIRDTTRTGLQQIEGHFSQSEESGYVGESGKNYSSDVSDESDSDSPRQPRERVISLNDEADAERSRHRLLRLFNEVLHGGERRKWAYSMLLHDSFRETLTWYVEDDTSYLYHPGKVSKTLIDDVAQLNKDMDEIQKRLWDEYGESECRRLGKCRRFRNCRHEDSWNNNDESQALTSWRYPPVQVRRGEEVTATEIWPLTS
ncbi:hypothetical protein Daesc_000134 [Daldinia eschscholtzii]|uniref:NACHT domain-containing protein n=1 Tax=Daldinia eschscholtzii TaxID=292717 RepID=A0AAX6MXG1_9PEZI